MAGIMEDNDEHLIKLYNHHPEAFPGHVLEADLDGLYYAHPILNHRIPLLQTDSGLLKASQGISQADLINLHYSKEAGYEYERIYYMSDQKALKLAKQQGNEKDFLPYRNVSRAGDRIVRGWEEPFVQNCITDNKGLAEFGSGGGDLLLLFPDIPSELYSGFDIAEKMIQYAREKFKDKRFTQADVQHLYLARNVFRLLIANYGPGSYWHDLEKEAKKLYERLDERGAVCLGLYSNQVKYGLEFEESTAATELDQGIQINFYTDKQAVQILQKAGFPYVVARGVNFDSTKAAVEMFRKEGKIKSVGYWEKEILRRDNEWRKKNQGEHLARHMYVFASKVPFELYEGGILVYPSKEQDIFPESGT